MAREGGLPMDPNTSEATAEQLDFAHDGGEQQAGDYLVGYGVEEAEGMHEWADGGLVADPGTVPTRSAEPDARGHRRRGGKRT
jgi:hypothetical protein